MNNCFTLDSQSVNFINDLNSIVDKKSPYNIVRHIYIKGERQNLHMQTTNLEIIMKSSIELEESIENQEIKVKSHVLMECLKKTKGKIHFEIHENKLKITDNKGTFELLNCNDKFPEIPFETPSYIGSIDETTFQNALKKTDITIGAGDKGVCRLEIKNQKFILIVSDQKKICFFKGETKRGEDFNFLFSPKYLKILQKCKGDVQIFSNSEQINFKFDQREIIIKSIDGNSVDHLSFIQDINFRTEVSTALLKQALSRCLITSSELIQDISFELKANELIISSYDSINGYSDCKITITNEESFNFFLNGKDCLDMISLVGSEHIQMFLKDNNVIFTDGESYYILGFLVFNKSIPSFLGENQETINIDASALSGYVDNLNNIVDKKSPNNIIRHIQIKNNNKSLVLTSTNLEIFIKQECDIREDRDFPEIKIKSQILLDCLKQLKGEIKLEILKDKLNIVDELGRFMLINCEDKFPEGFQNEMNFLGVLNNFNEAVKNTNINVKVQEKGVCSMEVKNNHFYLTVYDQKRICIFDSQEKDVKDFSFCFSPKYLKDLKKFKGPSEVFINNNQINLKFKDANIVIKAIEANKINGQRFLNDLNDEFVMLDIKSFKEIVNDCLLSTSSGIIPKLKIEIQENILNMYYYDTINETSVHQNMVVENPKKLMLTINLNGSHLQDMLKNLTIEKLYLFPKPQKRDIVCRGELPGGLLHFINIKLVNLE